MKIFNRILSMTSIILIIVMGNNVCSTIGASTNYRQRLPTKVGVFTRDINDDYSILLRKDFQDIQMSNPEKVAFSFYNANFNQSTQNIDIENALNKGIDLILLDPVNLIEIREVINKIAEYNIPVVFFNRTPFSMDAIKSYNKAFYVGTDSEQAGVLQGKMIVDAWNNHKLLIDKNKDDVLQYILLVGEKLNKTSIDRSVNSILTIQEADIKTKELAAPILQWDMKSAENTISSLLLRYGDKIEAIISNDDSMAIGAVQALQKYGYNKGNKLKSIPVVGVDGVLEAKELVLKGFMLGTAAQSTADIANTIYIVGMNLVYDKNPLEGVSIPYKLDKTEWQFLFPMKNILDQCFNKN